jgi:D-serine ammonia-lyase
MDHGLQHRKEFEGQDASTLPCPSVVLSLPIIKKNIAEVHRDVEAAGIGFRPHVKTLKVCHAPDLLMEDTVADCRSRVSKSPA